jgi:Protein of unknown function (DUF3987)
MNHGEDRSAPHIMRTEPPQPLMRDLKPADLFPVDALGSVLGPAACAIQDRISAPLAICGSSLLAAATLAAQARANVVLPTGQAKPISNYFVTIANTGERKSAVDQEALRPIRRCEAALQARYAELSFAYQRDRSLWRSARRTLTENGGSLGEIKAALDRLGQEPVRPPEPLLTCEEPTFEGLCRALELGQPSLGIFAAEGGQFIAGRAMASAKISTAAGLSKLWDGEPLARVRADRTTVLAGRRVAIHLMVQPNIAAIWFGDELLMNQGLLSRFLPTAPASVSGTRKWHEETFGTNAALESYEARLLEMLETPLIAGNGVGGLAPRQLVLSGSARARWVEYYERVEEELTAGGRLRPVVGLANKLPEHAARIAAVLTLVTDIERGEVASLEMESAVAIVQHYANEALRLFGARTVRSELGEAQQLLTWLHRRVDSIVSLPDIYQLGPNSIRDKRSARRAAHLLEEHGHLVRVREGGFIGETFRREVWQLVR